MGFAIAALTTLTLIYSFFGLRVIRPIKVKRKWKIVFWAILFVFYTALPVAILLRFKAPHHPVTLPLSWFAYFSFGFFTLTFTALMCRDVLMLVFWIAHGLVKLTLL